MKKIVTHFAPDLDAVTSIWLIKRFLSGWQEAEVFFVPAGETLDDEPVDSDPSILHVDTGLGKFDHHQLDEDTCAAEKIFNFLGLKQQSNLPCRQAGKATKQLKKKNWNKEALERLVAVVNDIDHFREVFYPNPTADFYDLCLEEIFDGLKLVYPNEDDQLVEFGLLALDGVYKKLQTKIWAEKLLEEEGLEFKSEWGKGIGVKTNNDEVIPLGQKQGYKIVIRKDPKKGYVRIKARPEGIDLKKIYNRLKKKDPKATWFFHASGTMILNGSTKNPKTKPTSLSLKKIIEILKH